MASTKDFYTEKGRFYKKMDETDETTKPTETSLEKALRYTVITGSNLRTITPNRPIIFKPITSSKKGSKSNVIPNVFKDGSGYYYNHTLTAAFAELKDISLRLKEDIHYITATFTDEYTLKLRETDQGRERNILQEFTRKIKAKGWQKDTIIVLEECEESDIECDGNTIPRLHAHLVTTLTPSDKKTIKAILKPFCMQVKVQDTWVDKRILYSEQAAIFKRNNGGDVKNGPLSKEVLKGKKSTSPDLSAIQRQYLELREAAEVYEEMEEEQFGPIPVACNEKCAENCLDGCLRDYRGHWENTYIKKRKGVLWFCRRHPVCGRSVDYLSKTLNKKIGKGRNFIFIGLKGVSKRRDAISKLSW